MKRAMFTLLLALLATPAYSSTLAHFITDANVIPNGNAYSFVLEFGYNPDWTTRDQYGRVRDSFQWFIDSDMDSTRPMAHSEFIIRGDEISEGRVRVCGSGPLDGGCPGGWGPDLGTFPVSYSANTHTLTFDIPALMLGAFTYDVMSMWYGGMNDGWMGTSEGDDAFRWAPFFPNLIVGPPPSDTVVTTSEAGSWVLTLIGLACISVYRINRIKS